jgi:hypothetical protein
VDETSVLEKRIREESNWDVDSEGGGLRSRTETLAPFCNSVMTVARPSPLEPPDTIKVRSLICILWNARWLCLMWKLPRDQSVDTGLAM